jgi:putative heme iron utilization protein
MSNKSHHIHQAALLMRSQHTAVLSTHSVSMQGYPFGSVMPFLMTEEGNVVVYASDIAQHSRNMRKHNKVSLCVYDGKQSDSQASARITVLGTAELDAVDDQLQDQYMAIFPQAKSYVQAHDFRFYLISTERVRYIGGFGEIYWFSLDDWQSHMFSLAKSAQGVIEHMHEDHGDALALIVAQQLKRPIKEGQVTMLSCYQHGFHYSYTSDSANGEVTTHIGFTCFKQPITKDNSLRHAMVMLTQQAKTNVELSRDKTETISSRT